MRFFASVSPSKGFTVFLKDYDENNLTAVGAAVNLSENI